MKFLRLLGQTGYVNILKQQSCDFIVALTHLELENDKRIAEALDIDFIIGTSDNIKTC